MDEFMQALGSWGVAPFSVLLVAAILYWLLVILGALDIDLLHLHISGHGDGAGDGHGGSDPHPGPLSGFLEFLSVGKVPLTVILSLLVFIGWFAAMGLALILALPWPLVFAGGLALAIPATGYVCRPLRAVFSALHHGVEAGISLLGREARITSVTCDASFGTATCDVGEAEVLLRVLASRPELVFHRDDVVVIADHDAERDVYLVGPATYRTDLREPEGTARPADPAMPVRPLSEPLPESPAQASQTSPTRQRLPQ